jgi:hypothetical protein
VFGHLDGACCSWVALCDFSPGGVPEHPRPHLSLKKARRHAARESGADAQRAADGQVRTASTPLSGLTARVDERGPGRWGTRS